MEPIFKMTNDLGDILADINHGISIHGADHVEDPSWKMAQQEWKAGKIKIV